MLKSLRKHSFLIEDVEEGPYNIDTSLLRAFVAVAETGGVTSAARLVNLTQAAVSQQVKRLEDTFGR